MSALFFLLLVVVVAGVGCTLLYLQQRTPTSLESGIDSFRREMKALSGAGGNGAAGHVAVGGNGADGHVEVGGHGVQQRHDDESQVAADHEVRAMSRGGGE